MQLSKTFEGVCWHFLDVIESQIAEKKNERLKFFIPNLLFAIEDFPRLSPLRRMGSWSTSGCLIRNVFRFIQGLCPSGLCVSCCARNILIRDFSCLSRRDFVKLFPCKNSWACQGNKLFMHFATILKSESSRKHEKLWQQLEKLTLIAKRTKKLIREQKI